MKKLSDIKSFVLNHIKRSIENNELLGSNLIFLMVLIIYIISSILLFNYYQYIIFSDGLSYITIAQEYTIPSLSNAINGYWSPLFSWMLVLFLFFGSTKMYLIHSAKILSVIIGFVTLIGVKFLFTKFINRNLSNIAVGVMIPPVLFFAFYLITPDLLIICLILFYLGVLFDPKYSFRLRNGLVCGFIGALAYFSKTFAFIFFILHFIIFNILFYFNEFDYEKKNKIKKNLLLGLTVFLLLSGIWIVLISDKYHEITIGTSGTYNQNLIGPESHGHPPLYQGLIAPPNKYALSSWEDASYFKMNTWNPIGSVKSFIFELNIVCKNIIKMGYILSSFSILSLLILVATFIFVIKNKKDEVSRRKLMYLLITIVIYSGGYCLIYVESRYLLIISILILLMGLYLIETFYKNGFFKKKIRNLLLIFLIISFLIMPINELNDSMNIAKTYHDIGYNLKDNYSIHGNIASNDQWYVSLILTYYLNDKYYGQTQKETSLNDLQTELKNNNIDYYFEWGSSNQTDLPYNEITGGKLPFHLKIYSVK
jgi:hypothetical protein